MTTSALPVGLSRIPWQRYLLWAALLFALYALRDFFFVAFVTFLLCYGVIRVVGTVSRRLSPDRERPWLDRGLTLATLAGMLGVLLATVSWMGPRLVEQSRGVLARMQGLEPQTVLNDALAKTVGTYLVRRQYGGPEDPRYREALGEYRSQERYGSGWFAGFPSLRANLETGFEARYEQGERERIEAQVRSGAANAEFEQWFLRVKAPALFAQRKDAYVAQWRADIAHRDGPDQLEAREHAAGFEQARDEEIRKRIYLDVRADPATSRLLEDEWDRVVVTRHWRAFADSPAYAAAFRNYYEERHRADSDGIPFSYDAFIAIRKAFPNGADAFSKAIRENAPTDAPTADAHLRADFDLAKQRDLAQRWWAGDPIAAAIRQHATEGLPKLLEWIGTYVELLLHYLLTLPTQLGSALLLTLFITFDWAHLRAGAAKMSVSRIGGLYSEFAPNASVLAQLIGRSFAAQAVIAVFNTLLTFLLLWGLGIDNELLLCAFVFIASFIPVLGVVLSGVPIALQALLQPDGSLGLMLQGIAGIAVIHLIEATVLSPRIVGKMMHLHPVVVLAVLFIGEHLFGIWGLLLGVPVAVYLIRVVMLREAIAGIYEPAPTG